MKNEIIRWLIIIGSLLSVFGAIYLIWLQRCNESGKGDYVFDYNTMKF